MIFWQFWTQTAVEIATAVGTLVLAAVAIWGDTIRARFVGPKLALRLLDSQGERITLGGGTPARFYHVAVENPRRSAPARNVRVVLTAVSRPSADGDVVRSQLTGPVQLTWQHGHSLPQYPTVGPPLNADLGFIMEGGKFQLTPMFVPNNLDINVEKGQRLIVDLLAMSDETESAPLRLDIAWDGVWVEDSTQMTRHLVIKPVPSR